MRYYPFNQAKLVSTVYAVTAMSLEPTGTIPRHLHASRAGEAGAADELFEHVYDRLTAIAQGLVRPLPRKADLDPSALVAAACEQLLEREKLSASDRAHFYFIFGRAMHDVVVRETRRDLAAKRTPSRDALADTEFEFEQTRQLTLRTLSMLLVDFTKVDPQAAMVVRQRFFAGRSLRDVATDLDLSLATVRSDWDYARAWLLERLESHSDRTDGDSPDSKAKS